MRELLDRIHGLKALVIGDVMLDHYVWGAATRISPEAPVPVVEISKDTYTAGGAANVALNLSALGAKTELWGRVGNDEPGGILTKLLTKAGVIFKRDMFPTKAPTIQKTRVFVQHQQLCRLDREAAPECYRSDAGANTEFLSKRAAGFDVVIFSDYAKGFLSNPLIRTITAAAKAAGGFVALDPKPRRPLDLRGMDLITPNRKEALLLAGLEPGGRASFPARTVCRIIWRKYKPRYLVITMGEDGMLLSEKGQVKQSIPTVAREVFDVTGAGDTAIAALSLALAGGATLVEAAHLANAAAGVVVGKLGAATASPEEVLAHVGPP